MSAYQRVGSGVPGHSGERQVRHLGGGDADNRALDRKEVPHLRVEGRSSTVVVFVSSLRGGATPETQIPRHNPEPHQPKNTRLVTQSQRKKRKKAWIATVGLGLANHLIHA